jgi:hypothetical protein
MAQNFIPWLKNQKHRNDPIGDLARDMIDAKFKVNPEGPTNPYEQLHFSISRSGHNTMDAQRTLDEALAEFHGVELEEIEVEA